MANEDKDLIRPQGETPPAGPIHELERTLRIVSSGSITEAVAGAGAVMVAILALAGLFPVLLAAIATIAIGVSLLAQGGAASARWSWLARALGIQDAEGRFELGGGFGAEVVSGAAGIVLGVLALIGMNPLVLLPVALLGFGGGLLLGSGATVELGTAPGPQERLLYERISHLAREAAVGATGTQALAGITAVVLGILALIGTTPLMLTLIGLLIVSGATLFSSSVVSTRLLRMLRR